MSNDPAQPPGLEGVVSASDLVAFQPGTVVSRTLVRKPAGTITVFAFSAGEGLSEHTAPFDAPAFNLEAKPTSPSPARPTASARVNSSGSLPENRTP